jgi:hypothetical protein
VGATFEPFGGFDEILYGGEDIEDDLYSILLSLVPSTIQKWGTFKLLRGVQIFNPIASIILKLLRFKFVR